MDSTLKELVSAVNQQYDISLNSDPVSQIVQILNANLTSLQWVAQQTNNLQAKLSEAEQLISQKKREETLRARESNPRQFF